MTANQIAYQANLETQRANRVKERETNRSNLAQEELTRYRDFSKAPVAYALYGASNTGEVISSPINVVAKDSQVFGKSLRQGIKSIFDEGKKNIAKGMTRRRERGPWPF